MRKRKGITVFPEWDRDQSGRVCAVDLLYRGEAWRVLSIHAPNQQTQRRAFFADLNQFVNTPANTIVGGDFNCVLKADDCSRGLKQDSSLGELRKLLRDHDLQDVTEFTGVGDSKYTHWQGECHARLDRIYVSSEIARTTQAYRVCPVAFSDHAIVSAFFGKREHRKRESGFDSWKLNESALEDKDCTDKINAIIASRTRNKEVNAVAWELLKEEIKAAVISHCQEKSFKKKFERRCLTTTLQRLIAEENKSPGVFLTDIKECKSELLKLLEEDYRGSMIRCRIQTLERDEEPVKIFKTKEREHIRRNKIECVRVGENTISDPKKIQNAFTSFYTNMFQKK